MKAPEGFSSYVKRDACVSIVDLNLPSAQRQLFDSITPRFIKSTESYRGQEPFIRLLELTATIKARTAVIEPYVSTDWNEEFGHLYSRAFKIIKPTACRIHFFGSVDDNALKPDDLFNMDDKESQDVRDAYLGYIVLRPLPAFRVSETMIRSPWVMRTDCEGHGFEIDLVHCQAQRTVSLLGNELTVRAMPFMQQDTSVGSCAEADLWMVARYANLIGDAGRHRPAAITRMATETITLGPPREGLIDWQMLDALRRMGLNAVQLTPKNPFEAREYIYSCVESNVPVIAGIPNHVVVVIGHDYKKNMPDEDSWNCMSEIVDHFIVHDDAKGAYLKKKVGEIEEESDVIGGITRFLTLGEDGKDKVDFCIAVMPERVNLTREDVKQHTAAWLEKVKDYVASDLGIRVEDLWDFHDAKEFVFRTYLRKSRDFKRDVLRGETTRNDEIAAKYRCTQMPRYIWVVELARRRQLKGKKPNERKICGELVFDATANRHVVDESLIAFHLDGMLYVQGLNELQPQLIVAESRLYDPLLRRVETR